jgi:serine/threonine-protein kinase RsbW
MATDRITLTTPARGEFARTVRMTATELASRMGMSLDDIDDVRIAVEESFVYACAHGKGQGEVTFAFTIRDDAFQVEVGAPGEACEDTPDDETGTRYARFILESVCDEFDLSVEEGTCRIRLVKRVS